MLPHLTILGLTAWIFQIAGTLTLAANANMLLTGGALPKNIVWVVAGAVTAGAGSHIEGIILAKTSVTLLTGATMNGRILSQTGVSLQMATVVGPSAVAPVSHVL